MKESTIQILSSCRTIKGNNFQTHKGNYYISTLIHEVTHDIYLSKVKDGNLVELVNLSKEGRKLLKEDGDND